MKKILYSAAIITGFIAPAIFAATQYAAGNLSSLHTNGSQGANSISNSSKICMKGVVREFNTEKKKISDSYKEKIKYVVQASQSRGTVSGEKQQNREKLQGIQKEYVEKLTLLKESSITKQRSCLQN